MTCTRCGAPLPPLVDAPPRPSCCAACGASVPSASEHPPPVFPPGETIQPGEILEASEGTRPPLRAPDGSSTATVAQCGEPPASARSGPATPDTLGRYEVLSMLGKGGMGVVWKAKDPATGRIVAVKQVLYVGGDSAEALGRFRREAEVARKLRHPGIVPVLEIGDSAGRPFIAMEYIDGCTLEEELAAARAEQPTSAAGTTRLRRLIEILADVAEAIDYAHSRGVIHRDVKPKNVLLDREGHSYVTDFGLAKEVALGDGANASAGGVRASSLTASGALFGTPEYMSPEHSEGMKKVGPPSDLWALGVILYQVLTGHPPFTGESVLELLAAVILKNPPHPRATSPHVPADLAEVCVWALEKEPSRRQPSAAVFAGQLRRWLRGAAAVPRWSSLARRAGRWARGRKRALGLAAGGLLAVAVAGLAAVQVFWPGTVLLTLRHEPRSALDALRAGAGEGGCELEVDPPGGWAPAPADGRLRLQPGRYALRFRSPACLPVKHEVKVSAGASLPLAIDLRLRKGKVRLSVGSDLATVPELRISVRDEQGLAYEWPATQQVVPLPVGRYRIDLAGDGFFPELGRRFEVTLDAETRLSPFLARIERWTFAKPVLPPVKEFLSVAVADVDGDGRLLVLAGAAESFVHRISDKGEYRGYSCPLSGPILIPPVVGDLDGDGRAEVLVANKDKKHPGGGMLACFSGKDFNTLLWKYLDSPRPATPPVVVDADGDGAPVVVFQGDLEQGRLVCLDGKTGAERWRFPREAERAFPARFGGPKVVDLDGKGDLAVVACTARGACVSLRARDGSPRWSRPGGDARAGNGVWAGSIDGTSPPVVVFTGWAAGGALSLLCLSARDGSERWSCPSADATRGSVQRLSRGSAASPLFAGVYQDGRAFAVDGATGARAWESAVEKPVEAEPVAGDLDADGSDELVVLSETGRLSALSATGQTVWTCRGEAQARALPVLADLDGDGSFPEVLVPYRSSVRCYHGYPRLLWSRHFPHAIDQMEAGSGDAQHAAELWAFLGNGWLYGLSGGDGTESWRHEEGLSPGIFALAALGPNGSLSALCGRGSVSALAARPGVERQEKFWSVGLSSGNEVTYPAVTDLNGDGVLDVVAAQEGGAVFALSGADRSLLWKRNSDDWGKIRCRPVVVAAGRGEGPWVVLATLGGKVAVLDGRTGGTLWRRDLASACETSAAVGDWNGDGVPDVVVTDARRRTLFLAGSNGEELRPAHEGRADWTELAGRMHGSPLLADLDGDGRLDAVLTPGGRDAYILRGGQILEERRVEFPERVTVGAAAGRVAGARARPVLIGCDDGFVYCLSPEGKSLWSFAAGKGIAAAPLAVDVDGDGTTEILVASADGGLVCLSGRVAARSLQSR
ncbi:MAG: VCBS repeat-containing protein [Planctomycetes bacterium]|nr:VCBS repeat-containing protein [Planctomycetota bacterium]